MGYTITLTAGLVLLIISLLIFQRSLAFLKQSSRATATVIEMQTVSGSDGNTYKPIFKFKTALNQEIIISNNASSNPPSWSVGDEVTVAYDPNNPNKAKTLTYFGAFGWTIILMAISAPAIVIGGGYYLSKYFLK